jgi:splicing factor 3B subunit 5
MDRHGLHATQSAKLLERITFNQMDHLHSRFTGTGDADTTAEEWIECQRRDTIHSILDRHDRLLYQAVAKGIHPRQHYLDLFNKL